MMRGDSMPMPDEKTIVDAYTYLLGRMLVIRQEHMDKKGDGFAYNAIKYNRLGSADFVNPNLDRGRCGHAGSSRRATDHRRLLSAASIEGVEAFDGT